jgi:hypothetical protein
MSHSFATSPEKIKESEAPKICPDCGWPTIIGKYNVECSNFDDCEYIKDFIEEREESKPTRYDQVYGIIIS